MAFSENSTIRQILANKQAAAILDKHLPGASTHPELPMAYDMTLKQISWYSESGLTPAKLKALVDELAQLGA
jgi:hypothetical protein